MLRCGFLSLEMKRGKMNVGLKEEGDKTGGRLKREGVETLSFYELGKEG